MYFLIEDDNLLKRCNTTWIKLRTDINKEFDRELAYIRKILKTKRKAYGNEAADFDSKEIPKMGSNQNCLAVIRLDSALKKDKNYHSQVFLKEYKYIAKEKELLGLLLKT